MSNPDQILRAEEAPLRAPDTPAGDAYARAGVDISAGNAVVERYREVTSAWRHPSQVGAIGGFSGLAGEGR